MNYSFFIKKIRMNSNNTVMQFEHDPATLKVKASQDFQDHRRISRFKSFRSSSRFEFSSHTRVRNIRSDSLIIVGRSIAQTKREPPLPRAAKPTTIISPRSEKPGRINFAKAATQSRTSRTIKRQEVVHATREIININYTSRTRNVRILVRATL